MEPESRVFELGSPERFTHMVGIGMVAGFFLLIPLTFGSAEALGYSEKVGAAAYLVALVGLLGGGLLLSVGPRGTVTVSERELLIAARWRLQKRIPLPPRHVRLLVSEDPRVSGCHGLVLVIEGVAGERIRFSAFAPHSFYREAGREWPSELYRTPDHTVSPLALNAIGMAVGYGEVIPGADSSTEKQVLKETIADVLLPELGEKLNRELGFDPFEVMPDGFIRWLEGRLDPLLDWFIREQYSGGRKILKFVIMWICLNMLVALCWSLKDL
jgi:hypothetical protein